MRGPQQRVEAPELGTKYRGGRFGDLDTAPGRERHHMPNANSSPLPYKDGAAIQMDRLDHRDTSSVGKSKEAQRYRQEVKDLLDNDKWRDAMAKEIRDVRRAADNVSGDRTKYNEAIREMLRDAKERLRGENGRLRLRKR